MYKKHNKTFDTFLIPDKSYKIFKRLVVLIVGNAENSTGNLDRASSLCWAKAIDPNGSEWSSLFGQEIIV